jgi:hypothetical protein
MKVKFELVASIQKDLKDSSQYDDAMDMLVNLVSQLNDAGRLGEAFQAQEVLVGMKNLKSAIQSIPNPGVTWR